VLAYRRTDSAVWRGTPQQQTARPEWQRLHTLIPLKIFAKNIRPCENVNFNLVKFDLLTPTQTSYELNVI
jgi:hypothetical protein